MTVIQINDKTYIMKYVSLIALTLQNAFVALSMRHGRIRVEKDNLFYSSTGKKYRHQTCSKQTFPPTVNN